MHKTKPIALSLIFTLIAAFISAQGIQPISPDAAPQYHFDLTKIFYPTDEAFNKDLAEATQIANDLQVFRGKVTESGSGLLQIAQKLERLNLLTAKLYIFRYLSYSINTTQEPQLSSVDQATSAINAKIAFVNTELRQLSTEGLDQLIKQEPKLADYRFFLEQNTRYRPHTLSADQEQLLASLSPDLYSWQSQMFQKLIDRTKFSEIKTDTGTYSVYRDRTILTKDKNRDIRKDATIKLYDEYGANADLLGFILIKEAKVSNSTSELRQYKDAFDSSLFDAYLTKQQAQTFFDEIGKYAPLMQRYIQLRKQHIKDISGIDPVEPWDMEVVPANYHRPQFTIQQTEDVIQKALAFHGKDYSADLAALFNPANRRLDIVKGANRSPGAFAWGVYGLPFVFYSFSFEGYTDDVLTLAHEAGHVVHYDLIYKNKVPFVYSDGPSYFTESFAMLNEFTTLDYLYRNATDKNDKIYFLEQWLNVAMRRFFDIVMRSEFEYAAYEKINSNEITEAEQVHQLWKNEGLKYVGEDYQKHDFLKYNWSMTPHFFNNPRYYINYLFANLMAISYYQAHQTEGATFDQKYVNMMVHGFPDTPINLLQKNLGLNPFEPAVVKSCMQVFEQRLGELQALYGK